MKGTLSDQPLAELIREISSRNFSGTLRLEHERAQAAVYFENGRVIFAASNVRSLRLQEYLRKRALATEKELTRLGNNLLREAGQRMPLKFVSARFRNPNETISRAPDVSTIENNLLPTESFLLSRLDAPTRLQELVAISGLRDLDAHRIIYGLALSGMVTREYWHHAFRADPAQPGKQAAAETAPPTTETREARAAADAAKEQADLETFLERLGQANDYYEIIDLPPGATENEIKLAYYALARRYHPDRFHVQSGTPQHARISSAFARITQAYETLTEAGP